MKKIENYIHGKHISVSKEELSVFDPSTGEDISKVVLSNNADLEKAIKSSKEKKMINNEGEYAN